MASEASSRTGLTDQEAQEFHKLFITGFLLFTGVAIGAHVLVWMWRPWFPGKDGYSMMDITQAVSQTLLS